MSSKEPQNIPSPAPAVSEAPAADEIETRRNTSAIRMQVEMMVRATFTSAAESKAWTLTYAKRFRELVTEDASILDRYAGTEEQHEAALKQIEAALYN